MSNKVINTWADSFGVWYARVEAENRHKARRLARKALIAEINARQGYQLAVLPIRRIHSDNNTYVFQERAA